MSDSKARTEATGSVPPGRPLGEGINSNEEVDLGPTGPASADGEKPGPQTGGYDQQSPDHASDNAKGGYGAG